MAFYSFLCGVKNGILPPWLQTSCLLQIEASRYYPAKIRSVSTFVRSTQTTTNSSLGGIEDHWQLRRATPHKRKKPFPLLPHLCCLSFRFPQTLICELELVFAQSTIAAIAVTYTSHCI
ncbi:hypothetical protein Hanom_Chr05g00402111 [Helianthus anomalus]